MKKILILIGIAAGVASVAAAVIVMRPKPDLIAFGDSITDGTINYGQRSLGYRGYLQDEIGIWKYTWQGQFHNRSLGIHQRRHSAIIGEPIAGMNVRLHISLDLFNHLDLPEHSVILIHAGTNDLRDTNKTDEELDVTVAKLGNMITRIHEYSPKIDIYVAQLIPSAGQPCERNVTKFNAKIPAMIKAKGYPNLYYVDMNAAFKNDAFGLCRGEWPKYCMADTLHPTRAGYRVMAKQWAACMKDPKAKNCNGN